MKLVHARLSIRNDPESRFCHCCGPMKLVEASLGVTVEVMLSSYIPV